MATTAWRQPAPSPIEILFWEQAKPRIPTLEREVWIGRYRVDFLIRDARTIIELYGYEYHSDKEKRIKDAQRERALKREGYDLISFMGSEITRNVTGCVDEVVQHLAHQRAGITPLTLVAGEPLPLHMIAAPPQPAGAALRADVPVTSHVAGSPPDAPVRRPKRSQTRTRWRLAAAGATVCLALLATVAMSLVVAGVPAGASPAVPTLVPTLSPR